MEDGFPKIIAHVQPNLVAGRWTVDSEQMLCRLQTTPILGWVIWELPYGQYDLRPLLISGEEASLLDWEGAYDLRPLLISGEEARLVDQETWDEGSCESRYSSTGWLLFDMSLQAVRILGHWKPIEEYEQSMLQRFKKVRAAQVHARKITRPPPSIKKERVSRTPKLSPPPPADGRNLTSEEREALAQRLERLDSAISATYKYQSSPI